MFSPQEVTTQTYEQVSIQPLPENPRLPTKWGGLFPIQVKTKQKVCQKKNQNHSPKRHTMAPENSYHIH